MIRSTSTFYEYLHVDLHLSVDVAEYFKIDLKNKTQIVACIGFAQSCNTNKGLTTVILKCGG